jgi:hypothetical protein
MNLAPLKEKRFPRLAGQSVALSAKKTPATAEAWGKKSHYRPLPKEFRHDGLIFRQIAREGNAAIYEQTWNRCAGATPCWEAIRVRRREGFEIAGRSVEPAEMYPNSEAWGTDGFTFTDKEGAFAKLDELG